MKEERSEKVNLVTILLLNEQNELLLIKRANEPFFGLWSLPGGKIHADESPEDAIKREVEEELGLQPTGITLLGNEAYTSPGDAQVYIFSGKFDSSQDCRPNDQEVQEIAWVSKRDIRSYQPYPPNHLDVIEKYFK